MLRSINHKTIHSYFNVLEMLEKSSSISHEFSPLLHFQYPRFLKFLNKIKLGRKVDK